VGLHKSPKKSPHKSADKSPDKSYGSVKRLGRQSEMQELLGLRHRETFVDNYLRPLLEKGWLEPTIPGSPRSRLQKYRLMAAGMKALEGKPKGTKA